MRCVSVSAMSTVCVRQGAVGNECVFFFVREGDSVSVRSRAEKKYCVRGSFVRGFENGHMETTRQTVFFSVVMDYQRAFWEWMGSYFAGGQISSNMVDRVPLQLLNVSSEDIRRAPQTHCATNNVTQKAFNKHIKLHIQRADSKSYSPAQHLYLRHLLVT